LQKLDLNRRLLHIYSSRGAGIKTIDKMAKLDPTLESIFQMDKRDLSHYFDLNEEQASNIYEDLRRPLEDLLQCDLHSLSFITRFDDAYPNLLKEIYDPPWVLFYKGNLSVLKRKRTLAVVGTRRPTKDAYNIMKEILLPLIKKDWCIVSGLAYGIDAFGHEIALDAGGATIAVLGSGIKSIYPKEHQPLADKIAENNLLISEYLPYQQAQKWQFPMRNRIISGLSLGTLVVEAKKRSGSLITADQALEQGREVFAIPGSILSENSRGTNFLIQQGAKLVMSSQDIENELIFDKYGKSI